MKKASPFLVFLLLYQIICPAGKRVVLNNIRFYSYPDYTRVVLDLSASLKIQEKILPGKNLTRLYFDLLGCDFSPSYPENKKKEVLIKSGNLKKIRLGKRDRRTLRIVFDFDKIGKYDRFYLTSPFRVVFDIFQKDLDAQEVYSEKITEKLDAPPEPVDGQYSVVRQLGLGVHRIVIDPGHGGKDPGTCNGKLGLYEKKITLDLARRLKNLFKQNSKYEIILTRESDRYISLEERTAIANSKKSDLFVSIHVNSAPQKKTRGIETFYLNLTTDPWSMSVAAKENAISKKSIWEMESIIGEIVKNAKKSESRILSQFIQKNVVKHLKKRYSHINDLGVKKAPFYVLVGARMPASLVETSFISNSQEARRLKTSTYRYLIANGLYYGIISYIRSLGKN
ncbi:MAG: N-acetylmuramoyl-L-alanine amidase [Candidatus Aminicenantes bacterium]|nr:N-acetylmuramoyl-L-alanine amidase [Candidatus Aminicenantes bacterium]